MLIGLTGYAGAGKDTVAEYLEREHGFARRAFADKLKELALAIDPVIFGPLRLSDAIEARGSFEAAKREVPAVRRFLQVLATEGCRAVFGDDFWVDQVLDPPGCGPVPLALKGSMVISDVRFPNEAARIRQLGGIVVLVTRPGHGAVNDHVSERGLVADAVLANDGTLRDLAINTESLLQALNPREDSE